MKRNLKSLYASIFFLVISLSACKKYLDVKPDKALQVPTTLNDLQALLDNGFFMNGQNGVSFDEASADNYYVPSTEYNDLSLDNKSAYIWQNNDYRNYPNDWAYVYNIVNVANISLENVEKIALTSLNQSEWNNVKGSASFFRAYSFLQGAFIFCKTYDETTSSQDFGLVLKVKSDITLPSIRSNVKETYDRIIDDLKSAIPILPTLPKSVFRPSKSSAYALLARTYLSMRKYDSCLKYANLSINIKNDLLDYNTLDPNAFQPFSHSNKEVLFQNVIIQPTYASIDRYYARIDTNLYASYTADDLRKTLFFDQSFPGYVFKGSYSPYEKYIGITTDEVFLMRAECYARLGSRDAALNDLNTLMVKRWKSGLFIPFTAATSQEALSLILTERRKELIFRNLRWMDIKRLNKEGANISLTRIVGGQTYTLPPNDNRFALALPADIINMTGMPQNPN